MTRYIPLSLIGSAVVLCLAATTGQAAVLGTKTAVAASHASIVSKTGWHHRHRHCWWRHHHRHCR